MLLQLACSMKISKLCIHQRFVDIRICVCMCNLLVLDYENFIDGRFYELQSPFLLVSCIKVIIRDKPSHNDQESNYTCFYYQYLQI